ncbi:MAG: hypothetical protein U0572_06340 [Phycisphaerales bacterium]
MRSAPAILWASAFIIAALVIVTAGRLPENAAYGNMATTGTGGYSLVTAVGGNGPFELLYVIDNTTQTFYVYSIDNANDRRIVYRHGARLPDLFRAGRG